MLLSHGEVNCIVTPSWRTTLVCRITGQRCVCVIAIFFFKLSKFSADTLNFYLDEARARSADFHQVVIWDSTSVAGSRWTAPRGVQPPANFNTGEVWSRGCAQDGPIWSCQRIVLRFLFAVCIKRVMGGVVGLLDGWGCYSKPHGITGRLQSSAQIRNKWGGKCNHTSIAAHFDMAEDCVLWKHLGSNSAVRGRHKKVCLLEPQSDTWVCLQTRILRRRRG